MNVLPTLPYAHRIRRLLFPRQAALSNAAEAVAEFARTRDAPNPAGYEVAAQNPAELSDVHGVGRLGTALWEVFPAHVALLDSDGIVVSVNRAWRRFGLANASPTAGIGLNYPDLCRQGALSGDPHAAEVEASVRTALAGHAPDHRPVYPAHGPDGERWFSLQAIPVPGRNSGALIVHTDVTAERRTQQDLTHRALHDPLTGLPNRALITDRLTHALAGAARDPKSLAVLFIDLDAFKSVNDEAGHAAGDHVLRTVSERMLGAVRTSDTVGRWGGDEFLVVAEHLDAATTAAGLSRRLADIVRAPIDVGGRCLQVGASIGIAHLADHVDAASLIDAADAAMRDGRDRQRQTPTRTR